MARFDTDYLKPVSINGSEMDDEEFFFVLAHEVTHKFQFAFWEDPHSDYVQLEGQADVIASRITGRNIPIADHGIPYEKLMTREQFFAAMKHIRQEALEQIRFYAAQRDFI